MKFKALRNKESGEFGHIIRVVAVDMLFTSSHPVLLPITSTLEGIKEFYKTSPRLADEDFMNTLDDYELIELDVFEENTVGADIRNKLSPMKNLIAMLEHTDIISHVKEKTRDIMLKEMEKSKECIKYLSELL